MGVNWSGYRSDPWRQPRSGRRLSGKYVPANVALVLNFAMVYPTMARTRTGLSAAFLFFPGATMMSEPVSGRVASVADPSIT